MKPRIHDLRVKQMSDDSVKMWEYIKQECYMMDAVTDVREELSQTR